MTSSRRLSLHSSALTDDEYALYTHAIADLALDESLNSSVGVREVRAWLRGRFDAVSVNDIDTILKFFSPTLGASDTLSPGQFYAAIRLVVHVDSGKQLDKQLAFVQARPASSPSNPPIPSLASRSRSKSPIGPPPSPPPKRAVPPPQRSQSQRLPSSSAASHRTTNPFALPTAPQPSLGTPPMLPPRKYRTENPNASSPATGPPAPPPPPNRNTSNLNLTFPPPAPLFLSTNSSVTTPHLTSTLMKQSLQASKTGQTMKNAEKMLEKERIMQVLKSSSSTSTSPAFGVSSATTTPSLARRATSPHKAPHSSSSVSSASGSNDGQHVAPPLPKRRTHVEQQHAVDVDAMSTWTSGTAGTLEQVAHASLPTPQSLSSSSKGPPPKPPTKPTFLSSTSNASSAGTNHNNTSFLPGKIQTSPAPLPPLHMSGSSSPSAVSSGSASPVDPTSAGAGGSSSMTSSRPPMHPDRWRRHTTTSQKEGPGNEGRRGPSPYQQRRAQQQNNQHQHGRSASVSLDASPNDGVGGRSHGGERERDSFEKVYGFDDDESVNGGGADDGAAAPRTPNSLQGRHQQSQQFTPSPSPSTPRMFRSRSLHVSPAYSSGSNNNGNNNSTPQSTSTTTTSGYSQPPRHPPLPPSNSSSPFSDTIGTKKRRPETMHYLPGFGSSSSASPMTAPIFGTPQRQGTTTFGQQQQQHQYQGGMDAKRLAGLRKVKTFGEGDHEEDSGRGGSDEEESGDGDEGPFSDSHRSEGGGAGMSRGRLTSQARDKDRGVRGRKASTSANAIANAAESHIQKTLNKLTLAKYKAEAGIMAKRGFVPSSSHSVHSSSGAGGGEGAWDVNVEREKAREEKLGLIGNGDDGAEGGSFSEDEDEDGGLDGGSRAGAGAAHGRGVGSGSVGGEMSRGIERDSMKWPVQPGEGWTVLS